MYCTFLLLKLVVNLIAQTHSLGKFYLSAYTTTTKNNGLKPIHIGLQFSGYTFPEINFPESGDVTLKLKVVLESTQYEYIFKGSIVYLYILLFYILLYATSINREREINAAQQ